MPRLAISPQAAVDTLWHTIIVGRGTAAAAYADNLPPWDKRSADMTVMAVGPDDPWKGARGKAGASDPSGFINQSRSTTNHVSRPVPKHSTAMMRTTDWAKENESVLSESTNLVLDDEVSFVDEDIVPPPLRVGSAAATSCLRVDLKSGRKLFTKRVRFAAGSGSDRLPEDEVRGITALKSYLPNNVCTTTEFAKLGQRELNGVTVFVIGPNAPIDAIRKALHYKCPVRWLIRDDQNPAVLDTQMDVKARQHEILWYFENELNVTSSMGNIISVRAAFKRKRTEKGKLDTFSGRYLVYGLGPDPSPIMGIVAERIKEKLEPIRDKDQVFGQGGQSILGLGVGDASFQVIGALAAQWVNALDRAELKEFKKGVAALQERLMGLLPVQAPGGQQRLLATDLDKVARGRTPDQARTDLEREAQAIASEFVGSARYDPMQRALAKMIDLICNYITTKQAAKQLQGEFSLPAKTLTSAVVDGGQIGTIIAVNRALGGQVPTRIGTQAYQTKLDSTGKPGFASVQFKPGEIDFNNDTQDDIQIGISLHYPYISTAFANRFVAKVVTRRAAQGTGVDDITVRGWQMELRAANDQGMRVYRDAEDALKSNPTSD